MRQIPIQDVTKPDTSSQEIPCRVGDLQTETILAVFFRIIVPMALKVLKAPTSCSHGRTRLHLWVPTLACFPKIVHTIANFINFFTLMPSSCAPLCYCDGLVRRVVRRHRQKRCHVIECRHLIHIIIAFPSNCRLKFIRVDVAVPVNYFHESNQQCLV